MHHFYYSSTNANRVLAWSDSSEAEPAASKHFTKNANNPTGQQSAASLASPVQSDKFHQTRNYL